MYLFYSSQQNFEMGTFIIYSKMGTKGFIEDPRWASGRDADTSNGAAVFLILTTSRSLLSGDEYMWSDKFTVSVNY